MTENEMLERVQKAIGAYSTRREIDASHPRAADTRVFNWPATAPAAATRGASGAPATRLLLFVTIDVGSTAGESDFDEVWSVTLQAWRGRLGMEALFGFTKGGAGRNIVGFGPGTDDPCLPLCLDALDAHAQGVGESGIRGDIPGWA